jgi:hypothetical protein
MSEQISVEEDVKNKKKEKTNRKKKAVVEKVKEKKLSFDEVKELVRPILEDFENYTESTAMQLYPIYYNCNHGDWYKILNEYSVAKSTWYYWMKKYDLKVKADKSLTLDISDSLDSDYEKVAVITATADGTTETTEKIVPKPYAYRQYRRGCRVVQGILRHVCSDDIHKLTDVEKNWVVKELLETRMAIDSAVSLLRMDVKKPIDDENSSDEN